MAENSDTSGAKDTVMQVLTGKLSPETHPAIFADDLLYLKIGFLENTTPGWLIEALSNTTHPIENRKHCIVCLSPERREAFRGLFEQK
jgi:hypothetical protein